MLELGMELIQFAGIWGGIMDVFRVLGIELWSCLAELGKNKGQSVWN